MFPKDPIILLSFINTRLRDQYSDLDALCSDMDIDKSEIDKILKSAGYKYSPTQNQYK